MPDSAVDHATIQEAYNRCEIDRPGFDLLSKQLDDMATPEGAELAALKSEFMRAFKPAVDSNDPDAAAKEAEQRVHLEYATDQKVKERLAACDEQESQQLSEQLNLQQACEGLSRQHQELADRERESQKQR